MRDHSDTPVGRGISMAMEPRDLSLSRPGWSTPAVDGGPPLEMRAGFGKRLVGLIIDGVILSILNAVIVGVFTGSAGDTGGPIGSIISFLVDLAYDVYFWTARGTTPGGMVMGLRLVTADGTNPSVSMAIVRYIMGIVSAAVIFIGYLWALGQKKRTWHDIVAGTWVINANA
jgi:uncharacterized RDD family membrane protein YckC